MAKETVAGMLRDQPVVMIPRLVAVNLALNV